MRDLGNTIQFDFEQYYEDIQKSIKNMQARVYTTWAVLLCVLVSLVPLAVRLYRNGAYTTWYVVTIVFMLIVSVEVIMTKLVLDIDRLKLPFDNKWLKNIADKRCMYLVSQSARVAANYVLYGEFQFDYCKDNGDLKFNFKYGFNEVVLNKKNYDIIEVDTLSEEKVVVNSEGVKLYRALDARDKQVRERLTQVSERLKQVSNEGACC